MKQNDKDEQIELLKRALLRELQEDMVDLQTYMGRLIGDLTRAAKQPSAASCKDFYSLLTYSVYVALAYHLGESLATLRNDLYRLLGAAGLLPDEGLPVGSDLKQLGKRLIEQAEKA